MSVGTASETEARFFEKVSPEPNTGCWLWTAYTKSAGYGQFWYLGRWKLAHRASYDMFVGKVPDGVLVCHKCDVPGCVNPDHLFLGTHQDNTDDMVRKGRDFHPKGEDNSSAKLSKLQVAAIRRDARPQRHIALEYSVSQQLVSQIKTHKVWTHI